MIKESGKKMKANWEERIGQKKKEPKGRHGGPDKILQEIVFQK